MHVETLTLGPFETNCYVVVGTNQEALVIDPGSDAESIHTHILALQARVVAIPLTHGHCDHVGAVADLVALHPAPVALHPLDARWAFTSANAMLPYFDTPKAPPRIDRNLAGGQSWNDAGLDYEVIDTPGHTKGGVSFYFPKEGVVFSGDCLFRGSVGRTDFPGGDPAVLAQSLQRLGQLPDSTVVYPGHGPATTIGFEKRHNPFMRAL